MKLKFPVEATELDDEIICVPLCAEANGVLKLNASGYEIVRLLEAEISEAGLVDALAARYETARATLAQYVRKTVEALSACGWLEG